MGDDVDLDGNYEFINGKPFDSLGLWAPGQPGNTAGWHCGLVKFQDPGTFIRDGVCDGWQGNPITPVCEHNAWAGSKVCTSVVSQKKWKKMCPSFDAERSCTAPRPKYSTVDKCEWVERHSIGYCDWIANGQKKALRLCGKAKTKKECEAKSFRSGVGAHDNCVWNYGNPPPDFIDEMEDYYENMQYYDELDDVSFFHYGLQNQLQSGYQYNLGLLLVILLVGMIATVHCYKWKAEKETVDFDEYDDGI